jgi:hypothetical protein
VPLGGHVAAHATAAMGYASTIANDFTRSAFPFHGGADAPNALPPPLEHRMSWSSPLLHPDGNTILGVIPGRRSTPPLALSIARAGESTTTARSSDRRDASGPLGGVTQDQTDPAGGVAGYSPCAAFSC